MARYLLKRLRLVQRFERQRMPRHLLVECDSDHAGCKVTRKSTSGYVIMMGRHCVGFRSVTQSVLALSSAEA
eukprot:11926820-Karenia_brevis.AAC.1